MYHLRNVFFKNKPKYIDILIVHLYKALRPNMYFLFI